VPPGLRLPVRGSPLGPRNDEVNQSVLIPGTVFPVWEPFTESESIPLD
jgi:hypothetical protein